MSREGVQVPPGEIKLLELVIIIMLMLHVQSCIGVLNFHRDHIPMFALVAKPLYDVMGPSATFSWGRVQSKRMHLMH